MGSGWMSDTLWITMRRSAPAISTPMLKAALIAMSAPKRMNAIMIDRTVKIVRIFRRIRFLNTRGRNFMPQPPARAAPFRGAGSVSPAPRHADHG